VQFHKSFCKAALIAASAQGWSLLSDFESLPPGCGAHIGLERSGCIESAGGGRSKSNAKEETAVNRIIFSLYFKIQDFASREEGQDLVEYALVVALIAFGAVTGMKNLASGINTAFNTISTQLVSAM